MSIDLQNDYLVLDGLEAVNLDGRAIGNCYRLPDTIEEGARSEGAYLQRDVHWQIPTVDLPAIAPVVGSTLIDLAAVSFTVLAVRQPVAGDYWGLTCRQNVVSGYAITLFRPTDAVDEFGSKVTTHAAVGAFTDIPAWVQKQPARVQDVAGKRGFVDKFHIYVNQDLGELHHGDLLRDQNLKWYVIESWNERPTLQALSTIFCKTHPSR